MKIELSDVAGVDGAHLRAMVIVLADTARTDARNPMTDLWRRIAVAIGSLPDTMQDTQLDVKVTQWLM